MRGNVLLPRDAQHWAASLYGDDEGAGAPSAEAQPVIDEARGAFFAAAVVTLAATGPDYPAFTKALAAATGRKGRALHAPVRAAVTGRLDGPELVQLFPLLGSARLTARFQRFA